MPFFLIPFDYTSENSTKTFIRLHFYMIEEDEASSSMLSFLAGILPENCQLSITNNAGLEIPFLSYIDNCSYNNDALPSASQTQLSVRDSRNRRVRGCCCQQARTISNQKIPPQFQLTHANLMPYDFMTQVRPTFIKKSVVSIQIYSFEAKT